MTSTTGIDAILSPRIAALVKGTVSRSLLLLYRKGLVQRHADDRDGRVVRLKLRRRGEALLSSSHFERDSLAAAAGIAPCTHFRQMSGRSFRCGLTDESLSRSDIVKICREHMNPAAD